MRNRFIEGGRRFLGLDKEIELTLEQRSMAEKYEALFYKQGKSLRLVFFDFDKDSFLLERASLKEIYLKNLGVGVEEEYAKLAFDNGRIGNFKRAIGLLDELKGFVGGLEALGVVTLRAMAETGEDWEGQMLWVDLMKEVGIMPENMDREGLRKYVDEMSQIRMKVIMTYLQF